jgi:hypothetical protein
MNTPSTHSKGFGTGFAFAFEASDVIDINTLSGFRERSGMGFLTKITRQLTLAEISPRKLLPTPKVPARTKSSDCWSGSVSQDLRMTTIVLRAQTPVRVRARGM